MHSRMLLPFLYQTPTIQRWRTRSTARCHPHLHATPSSRRAASFRRFKDNNAVPFEGAVRSADHERTATDTTTPNRKTTLTAVEREAFETLQKAIPQKANGTSPAAAPPQDDKLDKTIAGNLTASDKAAALDGLFDAVLKHDHQPKKNRRGRPVGLMTQRETPAGQSGKAGPSSTRDLAKLASEILIPTVEKKKAESAQHMAELTAEMREQRYAEKARVQKLMEDAASDTELWNILQREVFDTMAQLNLDHEEAARKKAAKGGAKGKKAGKVDVSTTTTTTATSSTSSISQPLKIHFQEPMGEQNETTPETQHPTPRPSPSILFPSFPILIFHAASLLRQHFPASRLILSILPTLKSLGRSSYMLGVTTGLYNLLLRISWASYGSYTLLNDLVATMDNDGVEFDAGTLAILEEVIDETEHARRGTFGPLMAEIWSLEYHAEDIRTLYRWRDTVTDRLVSEAKLVKQEGKLIRKTTYRSEQRGIQVHAPFPGNSGVDESARAMQRSAENGFATPRPLAKHV